MNFGEDHIAFANKVMDYVKKNGVNLAKRINPENLKSKPNDKESLDLDYPIKIREETEEFLLEIYNWPAFFRVDYGLITLFNNCRVIFKIFFENNKQYEEEEQKKRFFSFFESIIKEDHEKIKELTKINYEPNDVYSIKRGIEKLIDYFDLKSVENFFFKNNQNSNKIIKNGGAGAIAAASVIAIAAYFCGLSFVWVPIVGCCGLAVSFMLLVYFNRKKSTQMDKVEEKDAEEKINKMTKQIQSFFYYLDYKFGDKDFDLKNANIVIIAIDKTIKNYGDSFIQNYTLHDLNSIRFPKDFNGNDNVNMIYYKACFEAFKYYRDKFEGYDKEINTKDIEEKTNLLSKKILEDFKKLIDAKTYKEINTLINEEKKKDEEEKKRKEEKRKKKEAEKNKNLPTANREILDDSINISINTTKTNAINI